ncbi:cytokine receptor family member b2 [Clinocottus analis]|uniref:cytokine receptor family member b2 n=1 Tax=Clinocottus analis TaxID=304258 RepID=UPI0035C254B5
MTALVWMLAWLPHVLSAMNELPKPFSTTLNSSHFIHMLKWEPGPSTPPGAYYHVTVTTATGTAWVPVVGCEHVQHPLICNLTEAFSDPTLVYITKIQELLEGKDSQTVIRSGFKPIEDTHLDLPLLTVTPHGEDLCVDLQPPTQHLRKIYDSLNYKLRIKSNDADKPQWFKDTKSLRRQILKNMASGTQYCVSVSFSQGLFSRKSNYSEPVCASTPGHYTADPLISTMLCLLVMSAVVVAALLVYTGFTCLREHLPLVLTSIHHLEEVRVIPSCNTSMSSLLNVESTPPSSGEKKSNHTSDESDGESVTESTGVRRGVGYELQSSSSSMSAPLSPKPEPLISRYAHSNAGLDEAQGTHTAAPSDSLPMSDTVSGTEGPIPPSEEEGTVVEEGGNQDVDLHTLSFGGLGEEEQKGLVGKSPFDLGKMEPESSSASEASQTRDYKEVVTGTVSCFVNEKEEEEEEEEHFGYMRHPLVTASSILEAHTSSCARRFTQSHNKVHGETMGMWILLLLHLHLVACVSLPAPSNVSITSFNMEHTLSFLPGLKTPSGTCFTVQTFHLRKKTWRPVAACLKLTAGQTCNLTRAFKDPLSHYRARVQASTPTQTSNWTVSRQFQPLSDTVLGPPDVSVSGCGNCLLLQLRVPATNGLQHLKQMYRRVVLDVRRSRDGAQFSLSLPYKEENNITYLQTGVEYCVTVSVKSFYNSNSVPSKPVCAFTSAPRERSSLYLVISLLGAFCALGFLLIGLVVCASKLSIMLPRQPVQRALSYILLQCRNRGSADKDPL